MPEETAPPPVLDCARVLQYTRLDSTVEYSGRSLLFVGGKELGPVPCLAICEDASGSGVLLFHCTADWHVLGCSAHDSVAAAKARAEAVYHGAATLWVEANVTKQMADAYLNRLFGDKKCNICGRRADKVNSLVRRDSGWVCDQCDG